MAEMTEIRRYLPTPRDVVVVLPPGGDLIGLVGFVEAFGAANRLRAHAGKEALYRLRFAAVDPELESSAGLCMRAEPVDRVAGAHTLVVGGSLELARGTPPELAANVRRLGARSERVAGVCAGAFCLGDAGLLDGLRCTTHWLVLDQLRARFPSAKVEEDAIFVQDGAVYTSAGATSGIDLALHLIAADAGPAVAAFVARSLVVFARRTGGQSQFGSALRLRPGLDDTMHRLVAEILQDPCADHRVDTLARRAGKSPRHFARVFKAQTGATPAVFVTQVRIEAAKRLLGQSAAGLDEIAHDCGFGTTDTFQRAFRRVTGVNPSDWRRRFGMG